MKPKNNNLPKGWRKVKLGEIADIKMGQSPSSQFYNSRGEGLPFYQGITDFGSKYPNKSVYCTNPIKIAEKGEVLFSVRAPVGEVNIAIEKSCIGRGIAALSMKNKNNEFLYYLLKYHTQYFKNISGGTTYESIGKDQIVEIEVTIPEDINEQKRIADILSAFDEKIELNNKIIKTLEEMAQEVFKEWFVRFRFPGWQKIKFVDSELGKIPEGWEVKNIMEIIKRIPVGKRYDNKTALPKGKVPILDQGQSGIIGFHNGEPGVKASPKNPVAVFSNHTCYYRLVTFDFSCIQNVIPYIGINGYPTTFVFYLTKDKIKMSDYKGHWPEFTAQKFVVPPPELAKKFSEVIQPMIEKIDEITKENQKLAELRDLLLPKLMSGELLVKSEE
jgi:type I restriction enzyme S subunit